MGTTGQSITLANSIIGVGILAMPFCFQQCGVLLATLILFSMGLVSRLSCHFLLKSAIIARRRNFEFLALHVFGSGGKLAVEVGIIGFLMGTCIAYFVVVGDLGPQIIAKMFNINQSDILRTSIMVIVSLVCVLPLGLLRNVDSLSNVSAATIGFYFCLVIKVILEAASQMAGSEWHTRVVLWRPAGLLQCVPIFSMALFCQTQLFEVFESLPTISLEKMNLVTKNAINICTAVYFTLGLFGYVAFCSQTISGNILMSLSPTMGSDVIKLGFVMSLAFSFPLIIFPCRASLYSFLYKKVQAVHHDHIINHSIPKASFRCITVAIIAVALFISLLIPNIELVLGLVGSTIGVLVCIVFPTSCFIKVTFKNTNERVLAKVILVLGIVILVLGTYANLQAAENQVDKYDDNLITQERIDKIVEEFFQKNMDNQGGSIKPVNKEQPLSQDNINPIKEMIANEDSEVQPPNPVPPELHSNEEKHEIEDKKVKDNPSPPAIEPNNKSHPKNLKGKLDEAKVKLENNLKFIENKIQKSYIQTSNNIEPKQDENKSLANEEKSDILKKQELVETIKQHGEEQRELIKEQKEILHEIIKTQQELQKNKAEADSNEAKKIAVESIQKIANAAIQSLSGVSEKPNVAREEINKKDVPLEKIANDAVQEIAKKAVETIEAIKEIKEESKNNLPVVKAVVSDNFQSQNGTFKEERVKILENALKKVLDQNVGLNNQNIQPNVNINAQDNLIVNQPNQVQAENIAQNNNINTNPLQNNMKQQNPGPNAQPNILQQPMSNALDVNKGDSNNLKHSHSPDEPQSYKQGEELQIKNKNEIINNIPIPIAMNGNIQNHQVKSNIETVKSAPVLNNNNGVANDASNTNSNVLQPNVDHERQKREAVDCPNKNIEKEEKFSDLIAQHKSAEILPQVDLAGAFNKNLPLTNEIHHIRSLKSYDENER